MSNDDDDVFADDVEDDGGALEALIARLREARDAPALPDRAIARALYDDRFARSFDASFRGWHRRCR
mgnify:CR=1 FL=1